MSVLVTGGCGFIGTALVRALRADGAQVAVVDSRGRFADPEVRSVLGDLRDPTVLAEALTDEVEAVVHLAARTSVLGSLQAPLDTFEVNVGVTTALLERARQTGMPRFVFASTNAVVGAGVTGTELIGEQSALRPLTPYGASKAAAEMIISAYGHGYRLATSVLRLTNVYGPGMRAAGKDSLVPRLMRAAADDRGVEVYGDGRQVRDYVYVGDVVRALRQALDAEPLGTVVIGAGTSISVLDLLAAGREVTGRALPAHHVAARSGEMPAVRVDASRAGQLGLGSRVGLAEGLACTWAEYRPSEAGQ